MKNPTEELMVHILFTLVVGYFAYAQYDVKTQVGYFAYAQYDVRSPIGTPCHFPYFSLHVILNEVKDPTEELTSIYFITLVVRYFACAQYDVRSPIGTSCHFPRRRKRS